MGTGPPFPLEREGAGVPLRQPSLASAAAPAVDCSQRRATGDSGGSSRRWGAAPGWLTAASSVGHLPTASKMGASCSTTAGGVGGGGMRPAMNASTLAHESIWQQ
eukprot:9484182-Pyramimonas_sp.AAC.1